MAERHASVGRLPQPLVVGAAMAHGVAHRAHCCTVELPAVPGEDSSDSAHEAERVAGAVRSVVVGPFGWRWSRDGGFCSSVGLARRRWAVDGVRAVAVIGYHVSDKKP